MKWEKAYGQDKEALLAFLDTPNNDICSTYVLQFSDKLSNDPDVFSKIMEQSPLLLKYAGVQLKNNKKFLYNQTTIFTVYPELFNSVPYVKDDSHFMKLIFLAFNDKNKKQQGGLYLRYASDRLKDDPNIVLAAVKATPQAFQMASRRLKKEPLFCAECATISMDVKKHFLGEAKNILSPLTEKEIQLFLKDGKDKLFLEYLEEQNKQLTDKNQQKDLSNIFKRNLFL